ncbi:MAG: hypothetical protein OXD47_01495 [Gammaproteobacteria bacterium]|nr:hypothetical protein [Gammaproteobacteria bacterium]
MKFMAMKFSLSRRLLHRCCWCGILSAVIPACAPPDTSYFPVTPGYEWRYDISRKTPEIRRAITQKAVVRNLPATTVDGVAYYPQLHANRKTYYFTRTEDGISRRTPGAEEARQVIAEPLQVGTEWSAPSRLYLFDLPKKQVVNWRALSRAMTLDYTITSLDERLDVPAGRFTGCLRIDAVGFLYLPRRLMLGIRIIKVEQTQWYAPGVGLVKMTRKEYAIPNLYPSEYTQALIAFSGS